VSGEDSNIAELSRTQNKSCVEL